MFLRPWRKWLTPCNPALMRGYDGPKGKNCTFPCNFQVIYDLARQGRLAPPHGRSLYSARLLQNAPREGTRPTNSLIFVGPLTEWARFQIILQNSLMGSYVFCLNVFYGSKAVIIGHAARSVKHEGKNACNPL